MSETKHTPERWFIGSLSCTDIMANGWGRVASTWDSKKHGPTCDANAARIVACVNALAGLNPEAIGELVEAAGRARETIEGMIRYMKERGIRNTWGEDANVSDLRSALAHVKEKK